MPKLVFETPDGLTVHLALEDVSVLNVQPGDAIVVRLPTATPPECWEEIGAGLRALFPDERVVIMGLDCQLEVLRATEVQRDGHRHLPAV
jgi:hypothetical protein